MNELKEIYAEIERWHGIVASGIKPGTGNNEIVEITARLKVQLPTTLAKLKTIQEELHV